MHHFNHQLRDALLKAYAKQPVTPQQPQQPAQQQPTQH